MKLVVGAADHQHARPDVFDLAAGLDQARTTTVPSSPPLVGVTQSCLPIHSHSVVTGAPRCKRAASSALGSMSSSCRTSRAYAPKARSAST